jgi:tRNA A37 threonylcarbamoyladenosine synthetase subunit TsaC/SUA5/YrdC
MGAVTEPRIVSRRQIGLVLDALAADRVVAVPGSGGYCLAARLSSVPALLALNTAAGLGPAPAPASGRHVMVGRRGDAEALAAEWSPTTEQLAESVWPGPVMIEVEPDDDGLFGAGGDEGSLHVIMPRWRPLRSICRRSGPLAAVLPRRDGSPCTTAEEVRALGALYGLALVLDGGPCQGPGPTLVDCRVSPPLVRQVGELPEAYVDAVLLMAARRRKHFGFFTFGRPVSS